MDPANRREALREALLDVQEAADFLMVKPALAYLDIIRDLRDNYDLPLVCYNVSGEYSMIKAAAEKDWIDGERVMMETLLGMKRAGGKIAAWMNILVCCQYFLDMDEVVLSDTE
jgi:porphobilinogen synthase